MELVRQERLKHQAIGYTCTQPTTTVTHRFTWMLALVLCLFAAQSAVAVTAKYGHCCATGCEGIAACASMDCQSCNVPAAPAATVRETLAARLPGRLPVASGNRVTPPLTDIWTPPD
ncbi:MAG: hypothetical protein V4738_06570 [Pseudomonadota bacterium]